MEPSDHWIDDRMLSALDRRRQKGTLRKLHMDQSEIDFSSNDYLGLAHSSRQQKLVEVTYQKMSQLPEHGRACLGATGSRLLSGDSSTFHQLEEYLANLHNREAALLCNSGYDANLNVVSSLACDCIIYDEYIHNSLHMGLRLWQAQQESKVNKQAYSFRHNDLKDLEEKLDQLRSHKTIVIVESVYSMDGDVSPLREMLDIVATYGSKLVVDEAHGLGVYGARGGGVLQRDALETHPALLCSIHTFGKAAGCHGAVICGSSMLKDYLVNYAYPFIYSTALPLHSLVTIRCAYETMTNETGRLLRTKVFRWVHLFRTRIEESLSMQSSIFLLPSTSPIQALMIRGNEHCTKTCDRIYEKSNRRIRLFPIKSPTVPEHHERVRIILHAHNTEEEVLLLVKLIVESLAEMQLLQGLSKL